MVNLGIMKAIVDMDDDAKIAKSNKITKYGPKYSDEYGDPTEEAESIGKILSAISDMQWVMGKDYCGYQQRDGDTPFEFNKAEEALEKATNAHPQFGSASAEIDAFCSAYETFGRAYTALEKKLEDLYDQIDTELDN